jgi:hypothetical protein
LVQSEHTYLFAQSKGFDGQFYHYMAHDPFLRSDLKDYFDDPGMRYRRIFVPLLAYGLALGGQERIDGAYLVVCLLSIGLGVYWSCRVAQNAGLAAGWGLLFLAMPAVPISIDRLVVDGALAALSAAFVYYSPAPSWKLFVVLACAALTRDFGFLLVLAYCAYLASSREFRMAVVFLLSAAPALAWFAYVQAITKGKSYNPALMPFWSILQAVAHPWKYPSGTPFRGAVVAADYLALAGVLLAVGLALIWFARGPRDPLRIAAALFAMLALLLDINAQWQTIYNFGRYYTPMLLCLSGVAAGTRNPWVLVPLAMMLPRIAIQFAPQVLGIIHWMV